MDTIQILYNHEINKQETQEETGNSVRESYAYDEFFATLSDKQKELFLQYSDLHDYEWADKCAKIYRKGFQRGLRLFSEMFQKE